MADDGLAMPECNFIITVPGASQQELAERAAAAMVVFARLDVDPYAAARASFMRELSDEVPDSDAPTLSDRDHDLADAWLEATDAAMSDQDGWTAAPFRESQFELVMPEHPQPRKATR